MAREAKCYVVMGIPRYGQQVWREWARAFDGQPTPPGEVQVYRGVAAGYSPSAIWPVDPTAEKTVERRS